MKALALIGAGSVRTIYFMQSLIKFSKRLNINEIRLMDNDAEKLRIFGGLSKYLAQSENSEINVIVTDNFAQAVRGAAYVVTTLRVGQDKMRCHDERIALDMGLIGQETTGAGGFSYAIRTIPTMLEYMRILRNESPNAIVFNFTNPSGLVTQAIYDAGYKNVIGICDNATGIKIDLSNALQINAGEMVVKVYGLNHLSWANSVEINNTDILPRLMQSETFVKGFHQFEYFERSLIKDLGEIPNGYLYYFYHRERALKNMLASPKTRGEAIKEINERMLKELAEISIDKEPQKALKTYHRLMHEREGSYMSMELGAERHKIEKPDPKALGIDELLGKKPLSEVYEGYAGVVFNYIESLNTGKGIDLAICVPNNGAISEMENDDIVEVTCTITKNGAQPMQFKSIPQSNLLLMKTIKRYEKLTIQASAQKSKALAIKALMQHPLVSSYSLAKELVECYCDINKQFIGDWS